MTEVEWLTDPDFSRHIWFVGPRLSDRKRRLLAAAFCRSVLHLHTDTRLVRAVEIIEEFSDGNAKLQDLKDAWQDCRETAVRADDRLTHLTGDETRDEGSHWWRVRELAWAASFAASTPMPVPVDKVGERALGVAIQSGPGGPSTVGLLGVVPRPTELGDASTMQGFRDLVLDVAGNPFAPVEFRPEWCTGTVVALARGMYSARDFSAMPILADALQDAGCDDEAILSHCRKRVEHTRGCWVVDLLLGKK